MTMGVRRRRGGAAAGVELGASPGMVSVRDTDGPGNASRGSQWATDVTGFHRMSPVRRMADMVASRAHIATCTSHHFEQDTDDGVRGHANVHRRVQGTHP